MKNQITIMCGIDVHDNTLVSRIGIDREEPSTKIVKNTLRGRYQLFKHLKKSGKTHENTRIIVAYEASTVGFCIYDDCISTGIECHILAPTKMRKSTNDLKKKNDLHDANLILETLKAHILAGNKLPDIWIPDDATRDDRELIRARLNLTKKQTAIKTQIQTLLKRNRVLKDPEVGSCWSKPYRQWLHKLELPSGAKAALSSLVRQLECIDAEKKVLEEEIEKLSKTKRYKEPSKVLIDNIKGVALLTTMVYLTEMGDLSRFRNRKKIGAFLGVVPSTNESGKKNDRKGHITRAGPSRVRSVLCQAALTRIQHNKKEAAHYYKIVDRNSKHKKKAVVACMRRLGILMWHLALKAQQENNVFEQSA